MDMPANDTGYRLGLGKASWPKPRVMIGLREICKRNITFPERVSLSVGV